MKIIQQVAVLGASPKQDRYSHKALSRLVDAGHNAIPVNPMYGEIDGRYCADTVSEAASLAGEGGLDTLSIYLAPHHLKPLTEDIILARPKRVIFNPGTESSYLQQRLDSAGLSWIEACTLVLLATNQF